MVRVRRVSVIVSAALAGTALVGVPAGHGAAAQPGTDEQRVVRVRDVRLSAGDVIAFAVHPSTAPIEVTAQRLDLEACPGTWDGEVAGSDDSSWPTADGFTECIPLTGGRAALPSAALGGGSMHLVVAVRALATNERPGVVRLRYADVDGFLLVTPAPVDPGQRSPTIVDTPTTRTVAAGVAPASDAPDPAIADVRVAVRQGGRAVRAGAPDPAAHDWPVFAPVRPGRPVSIRAVNEGSATARFTIGVDVR